MHYAHFSRNFEKQKTQFVAFLECVFKTFAEYEAGFSSKGDKVTKNKKTHDFSGESWLGLENLHRLTSERSYSLKVTMTDYDGAWYTAVYDKFEVRQINKKECSKSKRLCIYL